MIVFGRIETYDFRGKKLQELASFLRENVQFRYVATEQDFELVVQLVKSKVRDLNKKYLQTVELECAAKLDKAYNFGYIKIGRESSRFSQISANVYVVSEFTPF